MELSNGLNPLDKIRLNDGIDKLKAFFIQTGKRDLNESLNLINNDDLHFTSLYLLQPEIESLKLSQNLNERNKIALEITDEIMEMDMEGPKTDFLSKYDSKELYFVFKWILETGYADDGLNDVFDEILDISAVFLITQYKDSSVLTPISDMIFARNRKGYNNHDLIWAFYEARDPYSFSLIADGLLSKDSNDIHMARKFLCFIPGIDENSTMDNQKQFTAFHNWMAENGAFLYYTGECPQEKKKPAPYSISLEAKYLCKNVSLETGNVADTLTDKENELLKEFNKLNDRSKILLSSCSYIMNNENIDSWNNWLLNPVEKQISIAKTVVGGVQ